MRFFAITAFATLAFGLFSAAAPTPNNGGADLIVARSAPAKDKCVDGIVETLVSDIESVISEVQVGIEIDLVIELCAKVTASINVAISDIADLSVGGGLLTGLLGKVLSIVDIAGLLCDVIQVVLKLVQCLLASISIEIKVQVVALLCDILNLVVQLITSIISICGIDLTVIVKIVVSLLGSDCIDLIVKLNLDVNLTGLINLLCIQL